MFTIICYFGIFAKHFFYHRARGQGWQRREEREREKRESKEIIIREMIQLCVVDIAKSFKMNS